VKKSGLFWEFFISFSDSALLMKKLNDRLGSFFAGRLLMLQQSSFSRRETLAAIPRMINS